MMAAENHRPNLFPISVPKMTKKPKTTDVVIGTLAATIPMVLPETVSSLESSRAASLPNSPAQEPKKSKHLSKPSNSPLNARKKKHNSNSNPDSPTSPSHSRPKWMLKVKNKVRRRSGDSNTSSDDPIKSSGSGSSLETEATAVATLPGLELDCTLTLQDSSSSIGIPTITVSSHLGDGECGGDAATSVVENGEGLSLELDRLRKYSQSSHSSTVGTSGVGSLLSPSGDEVASDLESPLSPMSGSSSFTDEPRDDLSDFDPIDRDLVSPSSDLEVLEGASISPRGSVSSETTVVPEDSLCSSGGGNGAGVKKIKRRRDRVTASWMKVKKVVQAWSPFAVQFKARSYPWVQLAGHEGNFMPGESGTIMKKSDSNESNALSKLMDDELRSFVPEFKGVVKKDGKMYVEMTDLLREFMEPAVMDIKMGSRTYLEEELSKARTKKTLRPDMYEKMIAIDPTEPTAEEHAQRAITKPRYMQWRESMSSTSTLGFRIEGIKTTQGSSLKDFKTMRERDEVKKALSLFVSERPAVKEPLLQRLMEIRETLERSYFFQHHEVVGSSLLFVFDASMTNIHLIDFGKTVELPPSVRVDHRLEWQEGNHEDGYLWGLDHLINLWREL